MRELSRLALVLLLAAARPAFPSESVQVLEPWVRGTVPGQTVTGAFMTLRTGQRKRLVAVRSPLAETVEIHEMSMAGDVMSMRAIPTLDLPAGQTVTLAPGGLHIMLFGLRSPLKPGALVPLDLVFQDRSGNMQTVHVRVPVRFARP